LASTINENCCFVGLLGGKGKESIIPAVLVFDTYRLRGESERSILMSIIKCFKNRRKCKEIIIDGIDVHFLTYKLEKNGYSFYLLDEGGEDYCNEVNRMSARRNVFILGAHEDIPGPALEFFKKHSTQISIGPTSLYTSHVITYLSVVLNRMSSQVSLCPAS
jgi:tRNA pseudouridine-54 N-methylase